MGMSFAETVGREKEDLDQFVLVSINATNDYRHHGSPEVSETRSEGSR
jgi:hypothetical protein